jgi:hypothetical protein
MSITNWLLSAPSRPLPWIFSSYICHSTLLYRLYPFAFSSHFLSSESPQSVQPFPIRHTNSPSPQRSQGSNPLIYSSYLEPRPSPRPAALSSSAGSTYASHPAALCSFALFHTCTHSLALNRGRGAGVNRERRERLLTIRTAAKK